MRNPVLLYSSSYSLSHGALAASLQTSLQSSDQYLLIIGTADSGDGTGAFPFAIGISAEAPEPGTFLLCGIGGIALALIRRRKNRSMCS